VVDCVSCDGEHKCVAIWKYDKREANGAPVVYYGMRLLSIDAEPALRNMVAYVESVLTTLGIRYGAMHVEVKLEARGPVLVEVNARLHGGEGIWLPIANACLGYTQVTTMYDAYRNESKFARLPHAPVNLRRHGAWVTVRSNATGTIVAMDEARIEAIRALPSYLDDYLSPHICPGGHVTMTIDACTVHGCFNLAHADAAQLAKDYEYAQSLIDGGIFTVQPETLLPSAAEALSQTPAQLPTFTESAFAVKVEYEAWVREQRAAASA